MIEVLRGAIQSLAEGIFLTASSFSDGIGCLRWIRSWRSHRSVEAFSSFSWGISGDFRSQFNGDVSDGYPPGSHLLSSPFTARQHLWSQAQLMLPSRAILFSFIGFNRIFFSISRFLWASVEAPRAFGNLSVEFSHVHWCVGLGFTFPRPLRCNRFVLVYICCPAALAPLGFLVSPLSGLFFSSSLLFLHISKPPLTSRRVVPPASPRPFDSLRGFCSLHLVDLFRDRRKEVAGTLVRKKSFSRSLFLVLLLL
ncbi:hypothetical protein MUK42_36659 [Musa troglodytarum]|uniref:Transmembrane protein n=1 Tax=Musa troglodytarum TaxID=320322 RepID=A0A9E7EHI8_9LILI|nr:hypothetical protein MUK42_36659 [Musa troglodytarum]